MANMSPEYKNLWLKKRLNKELNVGRSLPRGPFGERQIRVIARNEAAARI